jgi:tRNA G18 (ribose-2'-O)-methylase SpoU
MSEREPYYAKVPHEERPELARNPVHAVIDNFRSAYNVGSVFRTADACAVAHMHLCGMTAHPPHPKLAKTALGAFDYVPWTYYERTADAIAALRKQNIPVIGVEVAPGAAPHTAFDWPKPVAVVFGNEVTGINEKTLAQCDAVVCIPMQGYKNSINVANAFGIILYEILRRWGVLPE